MTDKSSDNKSLSQSNVINQGGSGVCTLLTNRSSHTGISKSVLKMCQFQLVAAILLYVATLARANDNNGCGGLLQGEYGRLQYPASQNKQASSVSSCLWTIQLPSGSDIRFTLDAFSSDSQLVLYPQQNPTQKALSSVSLSTADVGSSVEFKGRTLIVILPDADSGLSFTWESLSENEEKVVVAANYVDAAEGSFEWRQRKSSERLTYVINAHDSAVISYRTTIETYTCHSEDSCQCFYFGIFQVASNGSLIEAGRICGETSSEGTLSKSTSHVVAFVYTNAELSVLNALEISWQAEPSGTTETTTSTTTTTTTTSTSTTTSTTTTSTTTTTTEPPPDDSVRILAATSVGLVAISLDTLNGAVISPTEALGVAFDGKRSKAIWSEDNSIKRARLDGTELETLKTGIGNVLSIAIDDLTGNVYYSDTSGDRIMACNSEVEDCVAVATSPVVAYPAGIAVHVAQRKIYWTNRGSRGSIVKANTDGSNATQIILGLPYPYSIVVDSETERIYWSYEYDTIIESSDLEGGDGQTLVAFSGDPRPIGLAIHKNLLYIGNWLANNIQTVDKYTGANLTTVFAASGGVQQLAIADPNASQNASVDNPCEPNGCSHLCVPIRDSYRCLCPENMYLGSNQMICSELSEIHLRLE